MASLSTSCEDKVASLWLAEGPLRSLASAPSVTKSDSLKESGEEELVFAIALAMSGCGWHSHPTALPPSPWPVRRWLCPLVHLRWHALVSGLPCA